MSKTFSLGDVEVVVKKADILFYTVIDMQTNGQRRKFVSTKNSMLAMNLLTDLRKEGREAWIETSLVSPE